MIHESLNRFVSCLSYNTWRVRMLALFMGILLAISQAPISIPIGFFVSIPILGYCTFHTQTNKQAFGIGWWAGFGYFGLSMVWLIEPFFVEAEKHAILAPFALFFLAGGLALFWGGAFTFSRKFASGYIRYAIGLAVLWTLVEYLRSIIFTGFPWGLMAYGWVETPIAQWASILGVHGLGFVTILGVMPVLALSQNRILGPMLVLTFFSALWVGGVWRLSNSDDVVLKETTVRLVQPNAPQNLKWDPDWVGVFFRRSLELTSKPAEKPVDLVIWPETSVPFVFEDNIGDLKVLSDAAGSNAHIIAGIRRFEGDKLYNTMIHLDQKGGLVSVYDKHHLVPFGEYVPFSQYLSGFGFRGMAANLQGFSAGDGPQTISTFGLPSYLPLICYEAIFPYATRVDGIRPEFMLHITNDAWFGDYIGPYQHLTQVRYRAIEQGLPVMRSANTGISAAIDPYGRVIKQLGMNKQGFIDTTLSEPLEPTLYARWGDVPFILALLLFGIVVKFVTIKPRIA